MPKLAFLLLLTVNTYSDQIPGKVGNPTGPHVSSWSDPQMSPHLSNTLRVQAPLCPFDAALTTEHM
ncbi:gene trap locus F3b (predicted), isoform CRA_b [Rattus norvegicus]|uniref:Gene trap locus F3b (Predicted), isoform CRA_b n=1 Tax=Rattus norvegicus TaxID=10116 RepID=A6HF66_RAT|nr:gene trap locus F3b (predicted), isoform CRA_b [Rattus norvegicus]